MVLGCGSPRKLIHLGMDTSIQHSPEPLFEIRQTYTHLNYLGSVLVLYDPTKIIEGGLGMTFSKYFNATRYNFAGLTQLYVVRCSLPYYSLT